MSADVVLNRARWDEIAEERLNLRAEIDRLNTALGATLDANSKLTAELQAASKISVHECCACMKADRDFAIETRNAAQLRSSLDAEEKQKLRVEHAEVIADIGTHAAHMSIEEFRIWLAKSYGGGL